MVSSAFKSEFSAKNAQLYAHMTGIVLKAKIRDQENPLEVAEEIFKRFSTATKAEKTKLASELHRAYSQLQILSQTNEALSPSLQKTAARIFYLYGRTLYGGNMEASRQMLQLSVKVQLVGLQSLALIRESRSLDALIKKLSAENPDFSALIELLNKDIDQSILNNEEKAFMLGSTLHWLGRTYQNIQKFKNKDNLPNFKVVYGVAEKALKQFNNLDFRWEIGEIIYNSGPFMARLENPNNPMGELASLQPVMQIVIGEKGSVRGRQREAQLYNMTAMIMGDFPQRNKTAEYRLMTKAADVAQNTNGFDPFLKVMFKSNLNSFALESLKEGQQVDTKENMLANATTVMFYIEEMNYDHYYHAIFALNAAKIYHHFNILPTTHEYLEIAEKVAKKYPDSSADIVKKIESFRETIAPKAAAAAAAQ